MEAVGEGIGRWRCQAERGIPEEDVRACDSTTDFAAGLGCGRCSDNARAETKEEIREGSDGVLLPRSMPKGETSSPSVPSRDSQVPGYLGINFFWPVLFLFFSLLLGKTERRAFLFLRYTIEHGFSVARASLSASTRRRRRRRSIGLS